MGIYRAENVQLAWKDEAAYGTYPAAPYQNIFGLVTGEVELPDLEIAWEPFFGVGSSGRNRQTIVPGRQNFRGRIPEIWMQHDNSRGILRYILGTSTGEGTLLTQAAEATVLDSFTLGCQIVADDTGTFTRNYGGCKINRATFSSSEGEQLRLSIDEFIAQDMRHNLNDAVNPIQKYAAATVVPAPTFSYEEPYIFAEGTLSFFGQSFARIRRFSLTVDNQLTPQYYITSAAAADGRQILYEITEGKRVYTLSLSTTVDDTGVGATVDAEFLEQLIRQGEDVLAGGAGFTGFNISIVFNKRDSGDTITFTMPSAVASTTNIGCVIKRSPHGIPRQPEALLETTVEIDVPSLVIDIVDV